MQSQQSRCYGLSQLWEQVTDPFPWSFSCLATCVEWSRSEIGLVCSVLLHSMFFLTHTHTHLPPFLFLLLVKSCSRWGDRAQQAAKQSRKFAFCVQKHVLTVWATSAGIFTLEAILLCYHMTQSSWQVLFWHPEIAKTFFSTKRKQ